MRKLRIAEITDLQESIPPLNKNGLEQVAYYLTEEFVKMGHEVTLFATADSQTSAKLEAIWPKAVSRDHNKFFNYEMYASFAVSQAFSLATNFDIILTHYRYTATLFASLIKTPVVYIMHHPVSYEEPVLPTEYHSLFKKVWLDKVQTVNTVVVSNFQKEQFKKPCTVIHNGIPIDNFPFNENGGNYFVYLGYLTPNKGAALAVEAILKTQERLIIAGPINADDQQGKQYFEETIAPYLGNQIQYVGGLNYDEKIKLLKNAKGTLMPIQWDEPFGMVAIESLACGTPVIAWNRAAMPEIIEDGKHGFLVTSVDQMAHRINQTTALSRASCRQKVQAAFTAKGMADKHIILYEEILGKFSTDTSIR